MFIKLKSSYKEQNPGDCFVDLTRVESITVFKKNDEGNVFHAIKLTANNDHWVETHATKEEALARVCEILVLSGKSEAEAKELVKDFEPAC